jgi:uncharacterized phage protein gp47/JayE
VANFPDSNVDYTSKDFSSMLDRLQSTIDTVFPKWTDKSRANFGNILLESFAFILDHLTYYQDSYARESRWSTARSRRNLISLAKLVGFEPKSASAASTDLEVTFVRPDAAPVGGVTVTVAEGDTFRNLSQIDTVVFQATAEVTGTILEGETTIVLTIPVKNSTKITNSFESTDQADQNFFLSSSPVIDGTVSLSAAPYGLFAEVPNFLNSSSDDAHFTVAYNDTDKAVVTTGSGVNGGIPSGTVSISYEIGGGARGNLIAGTIVSVDKSYNDSIGTTLSVTCTNPEAASGGSDRETNASIRARAPETVTVQQRSVSRSDYRVVAEQVDGVARALMFTSNEDEAVQENTGELVIVPFGGGQPSSDLLTEVKSQFVNTGDTEAPFPRTLTFEVEVYGPDYFEIDVRAVIFIANGQVPATVAATVRSNLEQYFAITTTTGEQNPTVLFGAQYLDVNGESTNQLAKSDIFNVVRDTVGVRKIGDTASSFLLNNASSDVTLGPRQFPTLGDVVLIDGDTGATL